MVSDVSVPAKKMPELERWGQVLGTGCGSVATGSYRAKATKKAICWPFVKPSDGLEPSTPSLPWRIRAAAMWWTNRASQHASSAIWQVLLPAGDLPRRAPSLPWRPRTCPQNLAPLRSSARVLVSPRSRRSGEGAPRRSRRAWAGSLGCEGRLRRTASTEPTTASVVPRTLQPSAQSPRAATRRGSGMAL